MRFAEPMFLWGLLTLPLFALLFVYAYHRRKKLAARFVSLSMLPKLSTSVSPWRRLAKVTILLFAIAFLFVALARLQKSEAKSKVVVLLTDGRDNASVVPPMRAADVAQSLGVKVYTVGVGKRNGKILAFQQNPWTGDISWGERDITPEEGIDEGVLKSVAQKTGGRFYRAENKEELEKIYSEIDELEKTEIETVAYARYAEKFYPWLLVGALLILLELLLANTRFVRIP